MQRPGFSPGSFFCALGEHGMAAPLPAQARPYARALSCDPIRPGARFQQVKRDNRGGFCRRGTEARPNVPRPGIGPNGQSGANAIASADGRNGGEANRSARRAMGPTEFLCGLFLPLSQGHKTATIPNCTSRRGGRVVECGGLENRFTRNPGNEGSNPSSSAMVNTQVRQRACFFIIRDGRDSNR